MFYRLGLDLGVSSIGWAVIETDKDNNPIKIVNANSRIFSPPYEPKNKEIKISKKKRI